MTDGRQDQPWWRVDLGHDELVTEVYVVNRLDSDCGCTNRLDDFEIRVGRFFSIYMYMYATLHKKKYIYIR